eukprot:TRINITY_DN3600_c0_g1_i1.p3 TRINITY_DN3600_c0_g1~~TRINITY_DN3600_c0_g1_i1.p3  ORF type:complete len:102 (+),score=8.94 TRINITY_DN3600_c0_g1_i1:2313-2618(+)
MHSYTLYDQITKLISWVQAVLRAHFVTTKNSKAQVGPGGFDGSSRAMDRLLYDLDKATNIEPWQNGCKRALCPGTRAQTACSSLARSTTQRRWRCQNAEAQ